MKSTAFRVPIGHPGDEYRKNQSSMSEENIKQFTNSKGETIESRTYFSDHYRSAFGKSSIVITCPFCGDKVKAYLWSLAGTGKKCVCGAIHNHYRSYKKIS